MIDPKTIKNKALVAWVDNWAAHTTPDSVVWCDGSKEEARNAPEATISAPTRAT